MYIPVVGLERSPRQAAPLLGEIQLKNIILAEMSTTENVKMT